MCVFCLFDWQIPSRIFVKAQNSAKRVTRDRERNKLKVETFMTLFPSRYSMEKKMYVRPTEKCKSSCVTAWCEGRRI
jgi:hypothetical protein